MERAYFLKKASLKSSELGQGDDAVARLLQNNVITDKKVNFFERSMLLIKIIHYSKGLGNPKMAWKIEYGLRRF